MRDVARQIKSESREKIANIQDLKFDHIDNEKVVIFAKNERDAKGKLVKGTRFEMTHWAFNQLCTRITCPAEFMRRLPADLATRNLNQCVEDTNMQKVQLLTRENGKTEMRAVNSEGYGRIWNADILEQVVETYGDGVSASNRFRVPGEFGKRVVVDKDNTTLYMSDRDMFVFLTDEENRVELPNRRNGEAGSLARGFYFWNSEVGAKTFGVATFYFDYVCANRIIWGCEEVQQIKMRHSKFAPERFAREVLPGLTMFAEGSSLGIQDAIQEARKVTFETPETVSEFMMEKLHLNKKVTDKVNFVHMLEEERPIENMWDLVTGLTAYARNVPYQNERVLVEAQAGELLKSFSA